MGWFGKIAFGSLGLFLGGPLGAIAGAALGHHLVDKFDDNGRRFLRDREIPPYGGTEQAQAAYFISMFSILGKLSKIDGAVSAAEIAVVEKFIHSLPITVQEKQFAKQVFREAKDSPFSIDDFAAQLKQYLGRQPSVLLSFFDILFQVAAADGNLHPDEEAALKKIKNIFNISELQYNSIKSRYFNETNRYYKLLHCTPDCTVEEVKSNYKNLAKDFHPDTIISKGLPEEFVNFATQRFQEIQEAYEKIRKERNF